MFFFIKQKTAFEMRISDWSSDVCSSDLDSSLSGAPSRYRARRANPGRTAADAQLWAVDPASAAFDDADELVGDPAVIGERRMGVAAADIEAREVKRRAAVGQSGQQHFRDRCDLGTDRQVVVVGKGVYNRVNPGGSRSHQKNS